MIYIREAHAMDEWVTPDNTESSIEVWQPTTNRERAEAAFELADALEIRLPIYVDQMDDAAGTAYGAWPDRLYVVDEYGDVIYQGGYGPFGFKPEEVRAVLEERYGPAGATP